MVIKSETNGAHDGRVVHGPAKPRRGFVYQKFLETRRHGWIHSTRPVIIGREMPIVLEFRRVESDLFYGTNHCVVRGPEDVYSDRERDQLMRFANRIGLEFGELDVFRDNDSALIYVIDANRTSFKPSRLSSSDFRRAHRKMLPAMRRLIEGRRR